MLAYVKLQLGSLPFDGAELEDIVSLIVEKSQGIFLWVSRAVEETLATVHTRDGIYKVLDAIPPKMEDFLTQILDSMSANLSESKDPRECNKCLAKAILQYTICAIRPLTLRELQAAQQPEFGQIVKMEYTIKTVCPHLLRIEANGASVQPIHATVREFLLQNQHSEFAIDSGYAHQRISRICLDIWSVGAFEKPISALTGYRFQDAAAGIEQALDDIHPLLRYSSQAWFEHLRLATPGRDLLACVTQFLRTKALFWIETAGLLRQLRWLNLAAAQLEQLSSRYHHMEHSDRELLSGWAVDLVRIVPAFGQKIVS